MKIDQYRNKKYQSVKDALLKILLVLFNPFEHNTFNIFGNTFNIGNLYLCFSD